jgi:hypothetical protein
VAEVGRESEELAVDLDAFLVPAQEPSHREGVALIPSSE